MKKLKINAQIRKLVETIKQLNGKSETAIIDAALEALKSTIIGRDCGESAHQANKRSVT